MRATDGEETRRGEGRQSAHARTRETDRQTDRQRERERERGRAYPFPIATSAQGVSSDNQVPDRCIINVRSAPNALNTVFFKRRSSSRKSSCGGPSSMRETCIVATEFMVAMSTVKREKEPTPKSNPTIILEDRGS
jgi:hypothetical protein